MNVQPPKCKIHAASSSVLLPGNVVGKPSSTVRSDAAREAYAASLLASRGASKVYLGDDALRMIWPSGRKPSKALDCDVIATFESGSARLGEGKGAKDVYHAIEQFGFVAEELFRTSRISVTHGLIVVPPNLPFAYFDGTSWTHSDPAERSTFRDRLAVIAAQDPAPSAAYCFLLEENFRSDAQVPACAFIPTSNRYYLYTFARTGKWSAPRPMVFGPATASIEIVLAAS